MESPNSRKQNKSQSLSEMLTSKKVRNPNEKREPLWEGPESDGPNGGITYSLLTRFLSCRERFRIHTIEGLRPREQFNHRIEYGNMWHLCEETWAEDASWDMKNPNWEPLEKYILGLFEKYKTQQEQILHWYNVCKVQFPLYVKYWSNHKTEEGTSILQEQIFSVPYELPSGRVVRLRGKWDSVDLINNSISLRENKTKGDIDENQVQRQLTMDLQSMYYLIALGKYNWTGETKSKTVAVKPFPVKGILYNIVRRPLSGGKGTIRQHKATSKKAEETKEDFYKRVEEVIKEDLGYYFIRFTVDISQKDIENFKRKCLNPILESLCDWYSWITSSSDPFSENDGCENSKEESVRSSIHWQHPHGSTNWMDTTGYSDLDEYVINGSQVGLERVNTLFRELE